MIEERPDSPFSESKIEDSCKFCGNTRNIHKYDGEFYCKNHLNQKLALEG